MNLSEVNWRLALYSGGLLGGILWAILADVVISRNAMNAAGFAVPADLWLLLGAVSLTVIVAGVAITRFSRSIALRSIGIGLVVCASAGWPMIGWISLQGLF